MTKLKPLYDRLVVEPIEQEDITKGGIIIPDTVKEKPREGFVIAVGSGRINEDGRTLPMLVKTGDTVIYAKYGGIEVKVDNKQFIIIRESDILAIKED